MTMKIKTRALLGLIALAAVLQVSAAEKTGYEGEKWAFLEVKKAMLQVGHQRIISLRGL